jgi:hypothetical protein
VCRNIRPLANLDPPAGDDEINAAALQFVRKLGGFSRPSRANEAAVAVAVTEIAAAAARYLAALDTTAPPKSREELAAKAKARSARRFAAPTSPPAS